MAMNCRHNYDIEKIPRPPTPTVEDRKKAKAKKAAVESDDSSDDEIPPPTPKKGKCEVCKGKKGKETKVVDGEGTICWPCLWFRYNEKAEKKWLEAE